jgi:hypothetical protein
MPNYFAETISNGARGFAGTHSIRYLPEHLDDVAGGGTLNIVALYCQCKTNHCLFLCVLITDKLM